MLEVKDIYKTYEGKPLLQGISFRLERGETICLLGASGSGKSTLLRIIAGLETPEAGTVYWNEVDLSDTPPYQRRFGLMFQDYALFPHRTVEQNVAFGLRMQDLPTQDVEARTKQALETINMEGFAKRQVTDLSGGEQQRVALARALVMEPKVLLMDEPLSNLDAKLREEMRTEIRRIQKELNITSVYVTHDQIEAMTLSDRIVIMNQGIIEQIGTPVEVYRFPTSRFVSNFIGRANFVEGVVKEQHGENLAVEALGKVIHLKNVQQSFEAQDKVTLIVRPEMLRIKKQGELFDGIIRRASYLGDVIEYDIDVQGQMMTGVETDPYVMEPFPDGEQVSVGLAEGCIQVLPLENNRA